MILKLFNLDPKVLSLICVRKLSDWPQRSTSHVCVEKGEGGKTGGKGQVFIASLMRALPHLGYLH